MRHILPALALFLASVSVQADSLLPPIDGTVWEYQSTEIVTGETSPKRSVLMIRGGKQIFEGNEMQQLETISNNIVLKTELIIVDDTGISCVARTGTDGKLTKLVPPEKVIPAPFRVGTTWEQEGEIAGIKFPQHWNVVGLETVTLPASKFQAYHLHCEGAGLMSVKVDRWFAPDTGMVKEMTTVKAPGALQRVTLELQKITLPPSKPASPAPLSNVQAGASPQPAPGISATPSQTTRESGSPPKNLTVEVSSDPAGGLKTEFKSNVQNIYVRWHGYGLPDGARVRVAWVAEDVGDLVEPNFIVDETETIASAPNASARFTLSRPPDGWAEGKYRVEFYVDDELTDTVRVTIGK